MKRPIFIALALLVAGLALAQWNATKQQTFVERLSNLAHQMQDSREECVRLVDIWFGESVSTAPDFVDHPSGLTTAEMTAVITYCQDFQNFNENVAVTASQRRGSLVPFLSTRVRP